MSNSVPAGDETVPAVAKQMAALQLKELNPLPSYIEKRQQLWDKFKARHEAELAAKTPETIKVQVVADSKGQPREVEGQSWRSSPLDIVKGISPKSFLEQLVIAKVNGELWDL